LNPDDPVLEIEDHNVQEAWLTMLSDPKISCLVAEDDGKLIASCTLILVPNLTRGARPYGLIENVVTHPDYRKRGLGTQLLKTALEMAWQANCYKVMLMTSRKSEDTLKFYEQAGFLRGVKTGFVAKAPGMH
jgi:GNAT superfamily N-acetyltransferase